VLTLSGFHCTKKTHLKIYREVYRNISLFPLSLFYFCRDSTMLGTSLQWRPGVSQICVYYPRQNYDQHAKLGRFCSIFPISYLKFECRIWPNSNFVIKFDQIEAKVNHFGPILSHYNEDFLTNSTIFDQIRQPNLVEFKFKDRIRHFWSNSELFLVKFKIRPSLQHATFPISLSPLVNY
jgi:hypothetical protein